MQYKEILVKRNLEKSDEVLKYATLALNEKDVMTVLNRIYYAIFYTVCALAYKNDYITSKHTTLIGWFNKKFIHEDKVFDKKISKIYETAFANRQESDYDSNTLPEFEIVKELFNDATFFIKTVRKEI